MGACSCETTTLSRLVKAYNSVMFSIDLHLPCLAHVKDDMGKGVGSAKRWSLGKNNADFKQPECECSKYLIIDRV